MAPKWPLKGSSSPIQFYSKIFSLNQHMHVHTAGGIIFQCSDRHHIKIVAFYEPAPCLLLHNTTTTIGLFIRRLAEW